MTRFARWQDWVAVAAGLYAALASIWTTPRTTASLTLLIVLGAVLVGAGVVSMALPASASLESVVAVIGVLLFISPWVFNFASHAGPAWTAWVTGIVGVIAGLWAIEPATRMHHDVGRTAMHTA